LTSPTEVSATVTPSRPRGTSLPASSADLGHGQQVPDRDHADEVATVDHRQVPVVVVGQAGPCRTDLVVEPEHVGVGGHPSPDRLHHRVDPAGRRPQQVTLGEDADHGAVVGHHDRSDPAAVHQSGGLGERGIGGAGHRR
jgi:hypothetical protein